MSRKWIDYVGGGGALLALLGYFVAIALQTAGLLEEPSLLGNLVVGYVIGFFGAWFLKKFCDGLKEPRRTLRWAWGLFGDDWLSRLIAITIIPALTLLGVAMILGPVLGSAEPTTLVGVLIGATIFSEFTIPSYTLYLAEQDS
jgi:hypothetical protein